MTLKFFGGDNQQSLLFDDVLEEWEGILTSIY